MDLFAPKNHKPNHHTPLAHRMRPTRLEDFFGQKHLLGTGGALNGCLRTGFLPSMILYGTTGIGKTTLAQLLADKAHLPFVSLSATVDGTRALKDTFASHTRALVFVDEIHRLNKAQQDLLLPEVETGRIVLIGATTENPSFAINGALLSRVQLYPLYPLTSDEMSALLERALGDEVLQMHIRKKAMPCALERIIHHSAGDARRALGLLETVVMSQGALDAAAVDALANYLPNFDKTGDGHYQMISALIKSIRGSDVNASLYWLARLLTAGEDAGFIARRLVILASEDVGLANSNALLLAHTALQSVKSIGMPEARIVLSHVVVYLASAPKSNSVYKAINRAMEAVKIDNHPVPAHIQGTPCADGSIYRYVHDHPKHYCAQRYLPKGVDANFFAFGNNAKEQSLLEYLKWLYA